MENIVVYKSPQESYLEEKVKRLKKELEDAEIKLLLARQKRLSAMPPNQWLRR